MSVCIDALFSGKDFIKSMEAISLLGVKSFEFWSWWDKDVNAVKSAKEQLDLELVTFCTKFESLVDPSKREDYLEGLKASIETAKFLDCRKLITQVGNDIGISREIQHKNLVEGLKLCAPLLEEANITLLVEPLNTLVDHKGYYLYSSLEGFNIVDQVGSPCVKLLYDIYHQQYMEGNLIRNIQANIKQIGHFHAAGNPGRNELYFGEINYKEVIKAIDDTGYNGHVGLEYFPLENPCKGISAYL
ncbi:MAG: glyoxylate-induced protein [Eubacterium sp.]|nr:glyoxylate-induced protein [Eubacterium sp.]